MSWIDDLRPASFRGVPFEVLSCEHAVGRKVARHDYPFRDFSTGEDMGKVTGEFSLDAFVIGDDYMAKRDALDAALNTKGTGPLIVPWNGQRTVRLMAASGSQTTAEGGMCRYRLTFMVEEAGQTSGKSIDTTAKVTESATALQAQADTHFVDTFSVAGLPNFVVTSASDILGSFSSQIDDLIAPLKVAADGLDSFVAQGLALRQQVLTVIYKPASLISQVSGIIKGIRTIAATPIDALNALSSLLGFGADLGAVHGTTPARLAEADNQAALVAYVRQCAVAEAIQAVSEIDFAAYDDAVSTRDALGDQIDDLALATGDAGDNAGWLALSAARQAMVRDVTARGGSLAHLYDYTPEASVPALVLAYRLYDDTSRIEERYEDIVARNRITHPGFVLGGTPLEVLSDV